MVKQKITLDVDLISEFQTIVAKQGERRSRFVQVILEKEGQPWVPPAGAQAHFRALKPDGNMIFNPEPIAEDGSVTLELTEQTLAVSGKVEADLIITEKAETGDILATVSFVVDVLRAPIGPHVESSNEMLSLIQMIDKGNAMLGDYGTALEQLQAIQKDVGEKQKAAEETAQRAADTLAEANRILPEIRKSEKAAADSAAESGRQASGAAGSAEAAAGSAAAAQKNREATDSNLRQTGELTDEAKRQADAAARSADRSEQAANTSGYMDFEIEEGRLIYTKTDKVDANFKLEKGRLIVYA